MGAHLTETVVKGMNWTDIPVFYWTDSTTVLGWIKHKQECNWKVVVWNRVYEIRRLTKAENWIIYLESLTQQISHQEVAVKNT